MKEISGDAWKLKKNYTYLAITTNNYVKADFSAVMGRGIALEAKNKYPNIEYRIGYLLTWYPKTTRKIGLDNLIMFPVKHTWNQPADIRLIIESAKELMRILGPDETVLLPRPGCGNGGLQWSYVKKYIENILDDRVTVISFATQEELDEKLPF